MATSCKDVKPWKLEEESTFASFCDWQTTLLTALTRNQKYKTFVDQTHTDHAWKKKHSGVANRGLEPDTSALGVTRSAESKFQDLELMLQYIGTKVPHYLYQDIVDETENIESVWTLIRSYFNFTQNEGTFLDYFDVRPEPDERPERFYRRLRAFVTDNLIKKKSLQHNGAQLEDDEKLSPMVERLIVGRWLDLLHPNLRALIKRQFAADLNQRSIKDLQPALSTAMQHLLAEASMEDFKVNFAQIDLSEDDCQVQAHYTNSRRRPGQGSGPGTRYKSTASSNQRRPPSNVKSGSDPLPVCCVCLSEGRPFRHNVLKCFHIRPEDRRAIGQISRIDASSDPTDMPLPNEQPDDL